MLIPPDLPPVLGAEAWIKKIVIELLKNGIEYTPAQGEVWVRIVLGSPNALNLHVRDTGIGITDTELGQIFEPFYRGRMASHAAGTGLGLTLVKQMLTQSGGNIRVTSQPNQGTQFTVSLPLA